MIIKTYTSSSAITFIPGWGNISNNLFDIDIPSGYREIERHFESPGYNIAIFYTNNGSNPMYYSKHPSSYTTIINMIVAYGKEDSITLL